MFNSVEKRVMYLNLVIDLGVNKDYAFIMVEMLDQPFPFLSQEEYRLLQKIRESKSHSVEVYIAVNSFIKKIRSIIECG